MGRLSGKRAIITGAASGIGRASLLLFAREGARVLAVDREVAALDAAVTEAAAAGGAALALAADAGDEASVADVVGRCVAEWGGVDAVFANAGVSGGRIPLLEQTVEQWQEILRVNLIGPWLMIKHAAPAMIGQGGGSIVCTASVAALRANAGGSPYSASKAGVVSLIQTAANALLGTGVRVNAICPGLIETGMTRCNDTAVPTRSRPPRCSSPATSPPTSMDRPSRWTAACPARIRSRATDGDRAGSPRNPLRRSASTANGGHRPAVAK